MIVKFRSANKSVCSVSPMTIGKEALECMKNHSKESKPCSGTLESQEFDRVLGQVFSTNRSFLPF